MTKLKLREFVNQLIDDEAMSDDLFDSLLITAKEFIEGDRDWEILKAFDSSKSSSPTDTFETAKALPSDFNRPSSNAIVMVGDVKHFPIPFLKKYIYKESSQKYYIDYANNNLYIIGQPESTQIIYFPYIKLTDDLENNDDEWAFPARFHRILGYIIAGYYTAGVDIDDVFAAMSPEHKAAALALYNVMDRWNTKLALNGMGYSAEPISGELGLGENQIDRNY